MLDRARLAARQNRMLVRIFICIFSLTCLAIIFQGLMMTYTARNLVQTRLEENEQAMLQSVDTLIENMLTGAKQSLDELAKNVYVRQQVFTRTTKWDKTLSLVNTVVKQALGAQTMAGSVFIVGGDKVIFKSLTNFQPEMYDEVIVNMVINHSAEKIVPWTYTFAGKTYRNVALIVGIDNIAIPNDIGGLAMNLDMNRVAQQVFANNGKDIFYVTDKYGRVFLSTDMNCFALSLSEVQPGVVQTESGRQIQWEKESYILTRVQNTAFDYAIYHLTPQVRYAEPVQATLATLWLVVLALAAGALIVSIFVARSVYKPVKGVFVQLVTQFPTAMEGQEGHLDDLQQAQKTIVHTCEVIDTYEKHMKFSTLRGLLGAGIATQKELNDIHKMLAPTEETYFLTAVVRVKDDLDSANVAAGVLITYAQQFARVVDMPIGKDTVALVLMLDQGEERMPFHYVISMLQNAVEPTKSVLQCRMAIGVSDPVKRISDLPFAYEQARKLIETDLLYEEPTVLIRRESPGSDESLIEAATQATALGDRAGYDQAVLRLLTLWRGLNIENVHHRLTFLSLRLIQLYNRLPGQGDDMLPLYNQNRQLVMKLDNHTALMDWFDEQYRATRARMDDALSGETTALSALIVGYIKQHFMDSELSAGKVAEAMNISPSYLSRVLNDSTGISFSQMLLHLRMEKAKELLMDNPNISINEVGFKCGYQTSSYFTAAFKKHFGVPPSRFRSLQIALNLKDEEE